MVNIVMDIRVVGIFRAIRHRGAGAARQGQELQSDVIRLGAVLADGPDRVVFQHGVALHGIVEISLQRSYRGPGQISATGLPLVGDAPVVRLVRPLKGQQSASSSHLPGRTDQFVKICTAASQAPTEPNARLIVKFDEVLYRNIALDACPEPADADEFGAVDGLLKALSTRSNRRVCPDGIEEIRRAEGG